MMSEEEKLALDYRDAGLWWGDIPHSFGSDVCSKCGNSLEDDISAGFNICDSSGDHWYEYHLECLKGISKAYANGVKFSNPVKITF